jgi:hypothetical protein
LLGSPKSRRRRFDAASGHHLDRINLQYHYPETGRRTEDTIGSVQKADSKFAGLGPWGSPPPGEKLYFP